MGGVRKLFGRHTHLEAAVGRKDTFLAVNAGLSGDD